MVDTKVLSLEALLQITTSLNISMHSLVAVIGLLDEGGTVPFIAHYRKDATGNLDEVQIRAIEEKLPSALSRNSAGFRKMLALLLISSQDAPCQRCVRLVWRWSSKLARPFRW